MEYTIPAISCSNRSYAAICKFLSIDNYTLNDVVGKAGIEQVMDASLQGTKGYEKLYVDYLGKAVEVLEREEPSAGNDVYLSIDKNKINLKDKNGGFL